MAFELRSESVEDIICSHDPEEHRKWVQNNKKRGMKKNKIMDISDAVKKFVDDGDYIKYGFFGTRVSMLSIYEIIRQNKKNLDIGRGGVFGLDVLSASGCVNRVERCYGGGFEVRGLAPATRRAVESGKIKLIEWSNNTYALRLTAAAMGVPFIPTRALLGTETFKHSSAKVVKCPFTGLKVALLPACFPDVSLVHVNRADKYGNAQIDGSQVMDVQSAAAAKRVILTTEKIVDTEIFRNEPERTNIPFYHVDAVVEAPWGSHPSNVPGKYYMDEEFLDEWLSAAQTQEGAKSFLDKYIYGYEDFNEYLEKIGGIEKLSYLARLEDGREKLTTPWKRG